VRKVAARKIEIIVPVTLWEKLKDCEAKKGVKMGDLIARAIVKVIEEFEGGS